MSKRIVCAWKDIPGFADYDAFIAYLPGLVHAAYRRHIDISRVDSRAFDDDIACVVEIC